MLTFCWTISTLAWEYEPLQHGMLFYIIHINEICLNQANTNVYVFSAFLQGKCVWGILSILDLARYLLKENWKSILCYINFSTSSTFLHNQRSHHCPLSRECVPSPWVPHGHESSQPGSLASTWPPAKHRHPVMVVHASDPKSGLTSHPHEWNTY